LPGAIKSVIIDFQMEIPSRYEPSKIESKWRNFWLEKHLFHSEPDQKRKPFTIVIPPPNVTGSLHMGHALNAVLQDALIRWGHFTGDNTEWLPGTDHGGIATQHVVEKQLLVKGIGRESLTRESLLNAILKWKEETGCQILEQLRRLGCALDWDRLRFTMDETCSRAVYHAFGMLYERGLIYRGNYIVNWCPRCHTVLSELETESNEQQGHLWYIKYPLVDGSGEVTVATTRPETMLGDTAVAVNPKDKRHGNLVGKKVILPLMNREIPIIADEVVDPEFGTGAVKVTPSHDPNDFEIAKRHNLQFVEVIGRDARMTESAGKYSGMDRYECRKSVIADLGEQGLLEKTENYTVPLSVCYRCGTVLEPLVSEQWYLKTHTIALAALEAVHSNRIKFYPQSWQKPLELWLGNLRDWCLGRQIVWGHKMPVWYCKNSLPESLGGQNHGDGQCKPVFSVDKPEKCPYCGSADMIQDPDVIDTWFSSALWPFSTFGWPDKTQGLSYYYPGTVLVTGYEILYLWVSRMIMMGLYFLGDVPFHNVYIHGIVRDKTGKKMSKTLGNVIDPLVIMDKYGTDALRYSIAKNGVLGRDIQISENDFIEGRNFANKIWNASRFVLLNLSGGGEKIAKLEEMPEAASLADRWILCELNDTVNKINEAFSQYRISEVARLVYDFFWSKFCDWYLELCKPVLYEAVEDEKAGSGFRPAPPGPKKTATCHVLAYVLGQTLKCLHPVMPYITEEIWSMLGEITGIETSIFESKWPRLQPVLLDKESWQKMLLVQGIVAEIRAVRATFDVPAKTKVDVVVSCSDEKQPSVVLDNAETVKFLANVDKINAGRKISRPAGSAAAVLGPAEIFIPLGNILNIDKERVRLSKKLEQLDKELLGVHTKLMNQDFVSRAKPEVVEKVHQREDLIIKEKDRIERLICGLTDV